MKSVIIIAIAFVLLIPLNVFGEIENDDNQFHVNMILVSLDCSDSIHGNEFRGLTEIAYRYLASFQFPTEISGYCVTPGQFDDAWNHQDFTLDEIIIVMFNLDDGLWNDTSYEMFGYEPPKNLSKTNGTVFFKDKIVLMSYSLKDDLNSVVLTHEFMHFVLWSDGFSSDVYINQVHEDWKVYEKEYQQKEKLWSYIADKYYYVFR